MVSRTYSCNLCHECGDGSSLVGIEWKYDGWPSRDAIARAGVAVVENHLCHKCIKDIARLSDKLWPKR